MAITSVGATFSSTTNGGTVTLDLTNIVALAQNDIVVIAHLSTGAVGTGSTPAGWTTIAFDSFSTGDYVIAYKFMGATPDTSVSFWDTGGLNDSGAAVAFAFRGVHATTPLDVAMTSAGGNVPPPSITPVSANCAIFVCLIGLGSDATPGTPPSYTGTIAGVGNDTNSSTAVGTYRILSGGAGVAQSPGSFPTLTLPTRITFTIALRPAAVTETISVTKATVTLAGKTVTVGTLDTVTVAKATATWTGKTVTVRELEVVPVAKASATFAGKAVVVLSAGVDAIGVDRAAVTLVGKTVTVTDTPAVITIDKAVIALTGKSVGLLEKTAITKATVTFTGGTVTIVTSVFQDLPKYIIRGRGSRHDLWTQGFGGTIKGRGSRTFLVMR